jgi:carbamoyl-phosphate synthase small subunit
MKGYLVLEDGTQLEGELFGAVNQQVGEVVFNTSMTGYQEIITDPSYFNQIVVMTYPLVGNYGIHQFISQSKNPIVKGFVVREQAEVYSHWKGHMSLDRYLKINKIIGISGIDTRALVRKIRTLGSMKGIIISDEVSVEQAAKQMEETVFSHYVQSVTTKIAYELSPLCETVARVAVLDFGIKRNIIRALLRRGLAVKVFPADTSIEAINAYAPDGIFMSNGPGDPKELETVIEQTKVLINQSIPIFGICLGHQIISLALGCETVPMRYGHRGGNHPVKDLTDDRIVITAQNHGYKVVKESIDPEKIEVTHINLNDQTIEGMQHRFKPVFSVQYHPEASPGPDDSEYLFDRFVDLIKKNMGGE